MKRETFAVADIYVPVNRRAMLVQKRVDESPPAWPTNTNPGACGRRAFRAGRGPTPAGSGQGAWRENHHRLRRGREQALNGPPAVLAGDAADVT
jgi:hypothetical protein